MSKDMKPLAEAIAGLGAETLIRWGKEGEEKIEMTYTPLSRKQFYFVILPIIIVTIGFFATVCYLDYKQII